MPITWDESLATGSATVDRQHQKLFLQVAALGDAMKQGKGRDEIEKLLDFLGQYAVRHFQDEEQLMAGVCCPAAAANKEAHAQFLRKYGELRGRFAATGAQSSLAIEIYDMLCDWLVRHIKGIDVQLREWVDNRKPPLAASTSGR